MSKARDTPLFENLEQVETGSERVLQEYLKEVLGDKVQTSNLTPRQVRGCIKLMFIDKVYYQPIMAKYQTKDKEITNIPRELVKIVVASSKAKEGYGMETLKEVFREEKEREERKEEIEQRGNRR